MNEHNYKSLSSLASFPFISPTENLAYGGYRRDVYATQGHKMTDLVCCAGSFSWSPYQPNNSPAGSYAMACPTLGAGDPASPYHSSKGGKAADLEYPQKGIYLFYLFLYIFIYLFIYLFIHLFIYSFIYLFIRCVPELHSLELSHLFSFSLLQISLHTFSPSIHPSLPP